MKRILSLTLAVVLLFALVIPVGAAEVDSGISPRFTYISKVSTNLSISNLGVATCTGSSFATGVSSVKLICRLQQYKNGTWTTIRTWSDTGTNAATVAKSVAVYSGYTYRTYTSCYVYNAAGTLLETVACYSSQVTY